MEIRKKSFKLDYLNFGAAGATLRYGMLVIKEKKKNPLFLCFVSVFCLFHPHGAGVQGQVQEKTKQNQSRRKH